MSKFCPNCKREEFEGGHETRKGKGGKEEKENARYNTFLKLK